MADQITLELSAQIHQGLFELGVRLPSETRLATMFQVSRSVVREVLCNLQARGLVATKPGAGTFVVNHDEPNGRGACLIVHTLDDCIELLETRSALEVEAAGFAALRRTGPQLQVLRHTLDNWDQARDPINSLDLDDHQFQLQIARCTHNPYIIRALSHFCRTSMFTFSTGYGAQSASCLNTLARFNDEQAQIYAAISRQDPHAAQAAMLVHVANCRERLKARYCSLG
ncbi:FadR/GntR family transcriptional regulator [Pseudomonas syringae]|uniref:FadR/GntR family transcriptional regulator n=1 Tax=Pseudomonas syringae TaxID=317 RepID=UPI0039AFBB5E